MQRWMVITVGAALLLATVAEAQQGQGGRRPGQRGPGGPGGPPGGPMFEMMAERLAERLHMSEDQRLVLEGLVAQHRAELQAAGFGPDQMRGLGQEMRAAREAGDDARVAEIRAEMQAHRQQFEALNQKLMNSVEGILLEDQLPEFQEMRARMERGRQQMQAGQRFRDIVETLPNELAMTPEQRASYDELVAEQRAGFEARRGQWQEMRGLFEELREARAAGDFDRVREIEAELESRRPAPPNVDEFFAKLQPLLTAEQRAQLAEIQAQGPGQQRGPGAQERQRPLDIRQVLQTARRLRLNEEQQGKLRDIERNARDAEQAARRDQQGAQQRAETVKTEILGILDANQKAEFERLLTSPRGERQTRPGVGERERGPRPEGGPPPGEERPRRRPAGPPPV
ncbi:MAG: hypothetical protein IPM18_07580 [Phycisphaerales bacterium]|nr:hypothetical protein [Phycisphaerales bacterium]